jgi:hypothetical protein
LLVGTFFPTLIKLWTTRSACKVSKSIQMLPRAVYMSPQVPSNFWSDKVLFGYVTTTALDIASFFLPFRQTLSKRRNTWYLWWVRSILLLLYRWQKCGMGGQFFN